MKTGAMRPLGRRARRDASASPWSAIAAETRAAAEDAARARRASTGRRCRAVLSPRRRWRPARRCIHAELGRQRHLRHAPGRRRRRAASPAVAHRVWRAASRPAVTPACRSSRAAWWPTSSPATAQPHRLDVDAGAAHDAGGARGSVRPRRAPRARASRPTSAARFGIKIHVYQDDLRGHRAGAHARTARQSGSPSRRESFLSDIHAREQVIEVEVGGRHRRASSAACGRASPPRWGRTRRIRARASSRAGRSCACCPVPIASATTTARCRVVAQHKVHHLAVPRGRPSDRRRGDRGMLDQIARDLGARSRRDPPAQSGAAPIEMPWTSPTGNVYDSGSLSRRLARLLETAGYDDAPRGAGEAARAAAITGIGLACFIELTGPGAQFYGVGGAPISGQDGRHAAHGALGRGDRAGRA